VNPFEPLYYHICFILSQKIATVNRDPFRYALHNGTCRGASGIQVHMTNTRITDPEILKLRYTGVRLERFTLRKGSERDRTMQGSDRSSADQRFEGGHYMTLIEYGHLTGTFRDHYRNSFSPAGDTRCGTVARTESS